MRHRVLQLVILTFGLVTACNNIPWDKCVEESGVNPDPIVKRSQAFRKQWTASRPQRYTMLESSSCFCRGGWSLSAVSDASVTAFFSTGIYSEKGPAFPEHQNTTVEDWFNTITRLASERPLKLNVSYDTKVGSPTRISYEGKACTSDDFITYELDHYDPAHAAGVGSAFRCDHESLNRLAGRWSIVSAPNWKLGFTPVTAYVLPVTDFIHTSVRDKNSIFALAQLYAENGTSVTWTIQQWVNDSENWCGTIYSEMKESSRAEALISVQSESEWVLWNPTLKEADNSRERQWRFERQSIITSISTSRD